jgi:hypothetical protein
VGVGRGRGDDSACSHTWLRERVSRASARSDVLMTLEKVELANARGNYDGALTHRISHLTQLPIQNGDIL